MEHRCNVTFCVSSSGPAQQFKDSLMEPCDVTEWQLYIYTCVRACVRLGAFSLNVSFGSKQRLLMATWESIQCEGSQFLVG